MSIHVTLLLRCDVETRDIVVAVVTLNVVFCLIAEKQLRRVIKFIKGYLSVDEVGT